MSAAHETYTPPTFNGSGFHCPHCGVYAAQTWKQADSHGQMLPWFINRCGRCVDFSLWVNEELAYPRTRHGASPNPDMPAHVRAVYDEARDVSSISRKSAAGLLRLALQMLVDDLEPGANNINRKIGALVEKGLPKQIQQAMDALRVIGNESVHPGQIDLDGADASVVEALFALLNVIVEDRISKPKQISEMYGLIPKEKREGIENRDKRKD
ncbi:DUF4145 domain-containing protein [Microvirga sp. 0TCS3.31]